MSYVQGIGMLGNDPPRQPGFRRGRGSFVTKSTFDYTFGEPEIIQSLDVLTSNIVPFTDPDNPWVTALTLFHYTNKCERKNVNPDHAVLLTLADLICDEVPDSAASANPHGELAISAQNYIKSMRDLQPIWSEISVSEYELALDLYSTWPTLHDPTVNAAGCPVAISELMQAWAFCFKKPSFKALKKVRSALWTIIASFAKYGLITTTQFKQSVNSIATDIITDVDVSERVNFLVARHILPLMSNNNIKEISIAVADSLKISFNLLSERLWSYRHAMRTLVRALKKYCDFPWNDVLVDKEEFRKLLAALRRMRLNQNSLVALDNNYNRREITDFIPSLTTRTIYTFLHVAEELLVRIAGYDVAEFPDSYGIQFRINVRTAIEQEFVEKLIEEYVANFGRGEPNEAANGLQQEILDSLPFRL